ncbi:MAG: DeoR/GlpR family DNA-binding transcription regulator [Firmicutes bacterium]|nr:DeoR/GlpR family DNA-binding transcription regulator [Bacillota bacterium]
MRALESKEQDPQKSIASRRQRILAALEQSGTASIVELASRVGCSVATVRRDLARIGASGIPLRRYHGSVSLVHADLGARFLAPHIERLAEKQAVARMVAAFVPELSIVGLNGGTTTTLIARALAQERKPVRVVTNALNIAYELANLAIEVVIVGGRVQLPHFESTGKIAQEMFHHVHMDFAILGVEGLHPEFGVSTAREEEAAIADTFCQTADQVVVACDASKINKKALFRMLEWSKIDYVVTDLEGARMLETWPHFAPRLAGDDAAVWQVRHHRS